MTKQINNMEQSAKLFSDMISKITSEIIDKLEQNGEIQKTTIVDFKVKDLSKKDNYYIRTAIILDNGKEIDILDIMLEGNKLIIDDKDILDEKVLKEILDDFLKRLEKITGK